MTYTKEEIQQAKKWFGQGEYDVDLMIGMGAISVDRIMEMYEREVIQGQGGTGK